MTTTADLEKTYRDAEAKAQKLMADKDEAVAKARNKYAGDLRAANDELAAAQKEWLDAQAAAALADRPNGEGAAIAASLGLTIPNQ